MWKKKAIGLILVLSILCIFISSAEDKPVRLIIDGEVIDTGAWQVAPFISDGRTMVPLREVAELAGAKVGYNPNGWAQITEKSLGRSVSFHLGAPGYLSGYYAGENSGVIPYLLDGKMIVTVRDLADSLCINVDWDSEKNAVILNTELPGADSYLSPEWERKMNIIAGGNKDFFDEYISNKDAVKAYMFGLYRFLNTGEGSLTYRNKDGKYLDVTLKPGKIFLSGNSDGIMAYVTLNLFMDYENYAGADGIRWQIYRLIGEKAEDGAPFDISGETEKNGFTYRYAEGKFEETVTVK